MQCVNTLPQSVFNTQNAAMVRFLEDEHRKHQRGEEISLDPHQVTAVA